MVVAAVERLNQEIGPLLSSAQSNIGLKTLHLASRHF